MSLRGFTSRFGAAQLALGMVFVVIAMRAALVPSQNDTFWHLRAGEEIWRTHQVPHVDTYSFTSGGWPWRDHEWLWQPVSYFFYRLGGMPLMTLFGGALVVAAVIIAYRMMVGRAGTRCLLMIAWLPLLPSAWALRPQLFSLLAVPVLLALLARERFWPIPLLFVVWANAHGAVALGGVLLGVATAVAFARWAIWRAPADRRRALVLSAVLPLSAAACLLTPLGTGILEFLTDSMRRIRAVHIDEWHSSFAIDFMSICFWVVAAGFVALVWKRRRALAGGGHASSWTASVLTACALALLPLAIFAMRNIGPWSLLAVPAASHLLGPDFRLRAPNGDGAETPPEHPIINLVILAMMGVATIGLVALNYLTGDKELGWHPIPDRALAALRGCDGPLYNHYDEGGYLLWFARDRKVFVDGRQDPYPLEHVLAAVDVERGKAPYRPLFDRWGIRCVFLKVESPTVPALDRDGWITRYRDEKFTVLEAPGAVKTARPAAPAATAGAAAPVAPAPVDPEVATELIVGSPRGLEAWRRDGSDKRVISPGPALHPRWLDTSSVLALRAEGDDLAKGARIEKIALADGKRTRVALLPPFKCAPPPDADPDAGAAEPDDSLGLQDESDFEIDRDAHRASLTLMDRNINMADIILDVRVDLTTGNVERWLSPGGDEHPCAPPAGVNAGKPPDRARRAPAPAAAQKAQAPAAAIAYRFSFQAGTIVDAGAGAGAGPTSVLRVSGYDAESTSPSGRWAVLGGDVSEGDYIHRSLVLLDRTTGELFPIRPKGGAWPAALPRPAAAVPDKPAPKLKLPVQRTVSVVGETDTRWLGTTAASELLVVDALVVRPGVASFLVDGQLAR